VPFIHFLPEFTKSTELTFKFSQPFAYVPLNLVIDDPAFYLTRELGKEPHPSLYVNYIGWVPVLLALWAVTLGRSSDERRTIGFLAVQVLLAFLLASAVPLAFIVRLTEPSWLATQLMGVRHVPLVAGLAIPPLLALAGIAVDRLVRATPLRFGFALTRDGVAKSPIAFDPRWLLVIPLGLALSSARSFGSNWIMTRPLPSEVQPLLDALRTVDAQWVDSPYGEQVFVERAVSMGLKLSSAYQTWQWRDRADPAPVLEASREKIPEGMTRIGSVGGVSLYAAPTGREFAAVRFDDGGRAPCSAHAVGGHVDVVCSTPQPGILTVKENAWTGWRATVDGQATPLLPAHTDGSRAAALDSGQSGQWLSIALPAGTHTVQFRYRPWDVPLGWFLSLAGLGLALQQWRRGDRSASATKD
jgi:hypothetical protein